MCFSLTRMQETKNECGHSPKHQIDQKVAPDIAPGEDVHDRIASQNGKADRPVIERVYGRPFGWGNIEQHIHQRKCGQEGRVSPNFSSWFGLTAQRSVLKGNPSEPCFRWEPYSLWGVTTML